MPAFTHAVSVLQSANPFEKKHAAHKLALDWASCGDLGDTALDIPDTPARPDKPDLVSPNETPRRRLGTEAGRCALLHAITHIEFNAINLAADMICRFGPDPIIPDDRRAEFVNDWVKVTDDEARHFGLLTDRLAEMDYAYGDFPAHNGLWEAAINTRQDMGARLAVAPLVLEARGLDVTPAMVNKFKKFGDIKSADILQIIYEDEIRHVATGVKWFHIIADICGEAPKPYFEKLVKAYYKGTLKPPFNHDAREKAGLPKSYYA